MTSFFLALAASAALLFAVPAAPAADLPSGEAKIETTFPYLVATPPGYEADKTNKAEGGRGWPLVLFLHGIGERGTGVQRVAAIGLPAVIKNGKTFPFVMVAPQCGKDDWWDSVNLRQFVLQMQEKYATDPDRLYVTGLSMGGFGTWELITRYPNLFAAAAPVCGGGVPRFVGSLKTLPVWAFHGEKDPLVPVQFTRDMVAAITAAGNPNVKMTIYPNVGHDSWNQAYAEPDLFTWMLAQRRGKPATRPAK